jgi:hypothetical protein
MATENKSEILPWEPSPLEKQRQWLQDKMLGIGSFATEHDIPFLTAFDDPYYTRNVAENMTFASEFIPGFGDVQGVREGSHMMGEGQPYMGAAVMGLSALPFVPAKKLIDKVKVTPTKVERTNTGNEAVAEKLYNPETGRHDPNPDFNLLKEGRINFETNAERQLLSNPQYSNPNKSYDVDSFIKSTVANSPKEIRTTVKIQLDDWISPELRGNKATIQEILDDIGKNKPTIKENYMDDVTHRYTRYMPNIPTTNKMITNPVEALETVNPTKYTERSFSVHAPNQKKLFDDPGHTEVGQGSELRNAYRLDQIPQELGGDITNSANRIFTTRSGLYDIDGQKVFIPAEGQSGIYRMGTSKSKAAKTVGLEEGYTPADFQHLLETGQPLRNLSGTSKVHKQTWQQEAKTMDEWNDLVDEQQVDLDISLDELKQQHGLPDDVDWHSTRPEILEQAELITQDNAIEYGRKFSELYGKRSAGVEPPLFKEWFPMHMKTSLNDAVEVGADVVRFPVNPESVAKQTGQPLNPGRARAWSDELSTDLYRTEPDDVSNWLPSEEAQELGKIYKQRTNDGIKRIEAEYGIKLNPTEIMDDNYNEFLEIVLTPELKEAFQTVVYKDGGAVYKKPLMNLKY